MVNSVHSVELGAKVFAEGRRTVASVASIGSFVTHLSPASAKLALPPADTG